MLKKLLNVGKGHLNDKLQQQQQQQQKNLFQLNEIRSYGFSHNCCLGYSPSLFLLAVGSKHGLLRVLGNVSVEFNYQLEQAQAIKQIEFIDCRSASQVTSNNTSKSNKHQQHNEQVSGSNSQLSSDSNNSTSAKIVALTDDGQLHLFELKTVNQNNFADSTTQTDAVTSHCCDSRPASDANAVASVKHDAARYTTLNRVSILDYFKYKIDDEDRSRRITTFEASADGQTIYVGTEGGNVYIVPLESFKVISSEQDVAAESSENAAVVEDNSSKHQTQEVNTSGNSAQGTEQLRAREESDVKNKDEATPLSINDEPQLNDEYIQQIELYEIVKFDEHIAPALGDDVKSKKQGAVESIKKHPGNANRVLISYHRGLSVIFDLFKKQVSKFFYHNQSLESSCFASDQNADFFYTSHTDGSYIKWDAKQMNQVKANEDYIGQLFGPYPCKPTPKIHACKGLLNDQFEDLVIFSGGMPRATYDDKNPVTIVRADPNGKDTIKTVLDFTSKVLDFVVVTKARGNISGAGGGNGNVGKSGGGKKNKNKQKEQQNNRNQQVAVALAILAEEEFVVIDLLNSEKYLEFALPYLNCVHSSAITCNQHYSEISTKLYEQLIEYNKRQLIGKVSQNEWPISGGKIIDAPEVKSHDILLTGHEDGSIDFWDVSDLSMKHLLHLTTAKFFTSPDVDLVQIDDSRKQQFYGDDVASPTAAMAASTNQQQNIDNEQHHNDSSASNDDNRATDIPLKRVGRFDPFSDDSRLAVRWLSLCPQTGTLAVAGTGGQVLVFELSDEPSELSALSVDEQTIVADQRFVWKGRERLKPRQGAFKFDSGFKLTSFVQLKPPVAATSLDLRSEWSLYAIGTQYGFLLYDYKNKHAVVSKCTLNVQDFAIVSGDASSAMSRKKSFRKSLRESFRRLRRGRSQRATGAQPASGGGGVKSSADGSKCADSTPTSLRPAFGRTLNGVRTFGAPPATTGVAGGAGAFASVGVFATERQVEQKVELSSIVKCITLTSAVITNNSKFTPTLWIGTNAGQVLVYAIALADAASSAAVIAQQAKDDEPAATAASSGAVDQLQQVGATVIAPHLTTARLAKEIQLKHKAPIVAIFTTPEAPIVETAATAAPVLEPTIASGESEADRSGASDSTEPRPVSPAQSIPSNQSSPSKAPRNAAVQPRVLICSEEQFKVFNLPNMKPFCKFKLTAHEGLRAKKISITQFIKPLSNKATQITASKSFIAPLASKQIDDVHRDTSSQPIVAEANADEQQQNNSFNGSKTESNNNIPATLNNNHTTSSKELLNAKFGTKASAHSADKPAAFNANEPDSLFEPYMVCMSNQGDCAIYSVPDLKRQAQIQVCRREDVNGITSTMLTNYGEGFYLKSSSDFLRFSISTQRVLRVLSVV